MTLYAILHLSFFFSSRRRHTRCSRDWSSDVCSSDLSKTGSQRDGLRARIVLRRAEGAREADVAGALGVSLTTVSTWSRRFELQGLEGLKDRPGRGRKDRKSVV